MRASQPTSLLWQRIEFLTKTTFPLQRSYDSYFYLVRSGKEQPQQTNANRYDYNLAYEISAYSKGSVFLSQLGYIIGEDKLSKTLKEYYRMHQFKHPVPNDFRRVAERISGIQLKWYLTDWTQTTNTIDYGIKSVKADGAQALINIERFGSMPMPLEVLVNFKDGSSEIHYIPISLMRGEKENPYCEVTVREIGLGLARNMNLQSTTQSLISLTYILILPITWPTLIAKTMFI